MGPAVGDPVRLDIPGVFQRDDHLYGQIIRVDYFGNLITNVHSDDLARFLQSAQPRIEVAALTIKKISRIYADSEEGEPLALINSSNLLEIAVNTGRASEYLGIDSGEIVGTVVKIGRV